MSTTPSCKWTLRRPQQARGYERKPEELKLMLWRQVSFRRFSRSELSGTRCQTSFVDTPSSLQAFGSMLHSMSKTGSSFSEFCPPAWFTSVFNDKLAYVERSAVGWQRPEAFGLGDLSVERSALGWQRPEAFGLGDLSVERSAVGWQRPEAFGLGDLSVERSALG